jgi:hypothetical protein
MTIARARLFSCTKRAAHRLRYRARMENFRAAGRCTLAAVIAASVSGGLGCDTADGGGPPATPSLEASAPVPAALLNVTYRERGGLLRATSGADADPLVAEAKRYYAEIGAPGLPAGESPATFDSWKTAFGFPVRGADESLAEYRARTNVVVYYNSNELGLGRELGCVEFADGADAAGTPLTGVACYVTNYGAVFGDAVGSTRLAIAGTTPRNTVCIAHRPSLPEGYQVQFYVFGRTGQRQDWAQLDTLGARPQPHVCMNCHGGSYDADRHLAKDARFLPLDPNFVAFAGEGTAGGHGVTRAGQEEAIRYNNMLAARTPLTARQVEAFDGLYDGRIQTAGTIARTDFVPQGWAKDPASQAIYGQVVRPFCGTCHLATQAEGASIFDSADAFRGVAASAFLCNTATPMPNAQATMRGLWSAHDRPVTVGGAAFATPADALLKWLGVPRAACAAVAQAGTCARGEDPDSLCGDAHSGQACNLETGRCVPAMGVGAQAMPAPDFAMASPAAGAAPAGTVALAPPVMGVCRMDGSRACPSVMTCLPMLVTEPGLERYDGVCVGN